MISVALMNRHSVLLLASCAVLSLTACGTTGTTTGATSHSDRTQTTAARNDAGGYSLNALEANYKKDSSDINNATAYGRALRHANRLQRSAMVLAPIADKGKKNPEAKVEYAATLADMGQFEDAEKYVRAAIGINPEDGYAYQILGVSLEAQGKHAEAEKAFRKALENWQGNPSTVLNNLGTNLAAQGYIDDALETLRKAHSLAPDRPEIERNLRIVTALQPMPGATGSYNGIKKVRPKDPAE
jgi:Flp pilus assembly protein TadD